MDVFADHCPKLLHLRVWDGKWTELATFLQKRKDTLQSLAIHSRIDSTRQCDLAVDLFLPNMKSLCITGTTTPAFIVRFLACCPPLQDVIFGSTQLDDSCVQALSEHAEQLQWFATPYMPGSMNKEAVIQLARNCPRLRKVQLNNAMAKSDVVAAFATHCPLLEGVSLTYANDDAVAALATHMGPRLKHLSLVTVRCANSDSLAALVNNCTALETLYWYEFHGLAPGVEKELLVQLLTARKGYWRWMFPPAMYTTTCCSPWLRTAPTSNF